MSYECPGDGLRCDQQHVAIPLTQGQIASVDVGDLALVTGSWCATLRLGTFYATARRGGRLIYMHRHLLGVTGPTQLVDHRDGDGLNNCRANLRLATRAGNGQNSTSRTGTSRHKGVHLKPSGRWVAQITADRRCVHLGTFATEDDAALAYNAAALRLHGAFARLNEVSR